MGYVGIDVEGARRAGQAMTAAGESAGQTRQRVVGVLGTAELQSHAPALLATVQEGLTTLGASVVDKANLAEQFNADPQAASAALGAPPEQLRAALAGLLGFGRASDLRTVFAGLPAAGADPALDAALARLTPVLLPALLAGQRPALDATLDATRVADLRTLALRLGIQHAGPPGTAAPVVERGGFLGLVRRLKTSDNTEVFWHDFWADGRTVAAVLADAGQLMDWVAGTFELDRRLAVATALPALTDVLMSVDFATGGQSAAEAAGAEVQQQFPAIAAWLPGFLAGTDRTPPTAGQLSQTLAFAARVGWVDPGGATEARFADAVAFLRANRALGSALLPTAFEGNPQPLAFLDAAGIDLMLELGRRSGVVTDTTLAGLAALTGQVAGSARIDLTGATPPPAGEPLEQLLGALVASQVPPAFLRTPGLKPRFDAALTFVAGASTGPEMLSRIVKAVAAFRTLAVTGPPALTEQQLAGVVGAAAVGTLGQSRLRLRSAGAVRKNPEFLLVAQEWGVPGGHKQKIGKYKFTWSFDESGALVAIRRKKRSTLSRIADTVKAVVHSIGDAFEENPFKAILQVGKIALGALALVFPGTQVLGLAALALNIGDAALKAVEGDWLGALSAGLAVFTAGATDVFGVGLPTGVDLLQHSVVSELVNPTVLSFVKDAKRAIDVGTSILRAFEADSLAGAIGAGLAAGATALGSGGQLLGSVGAADTDVVQGLVRLGTTLGDLSKVVAPAAGLVDAAERGDFAQAFVNGLAVASGGAKALGNPFGAFSDTAPGVDTLFEFDPATQQTLRSIAGGTGIAATVAGAIRALDRGQAFLAGSLLAQAVQATSDPNRTALGKGALVAQRLGEIGAVVESIVDSGADPKAAARQAAPILLQRLQLLADAASTPLLAPVPPLPARNPLFHGPIGNQPAPGSPSPAAGGPGSGRSLIGVPAVAGFPATAFADPVSGLPFIGGLGDFPAVTATPGTSADPSGVPVLLDGGSGAEQLGGGTGDDEIVEVFQAETTAGSGDAGSGFQSNTATLHPEGYDPGWSGAVVFDVDGQSFIGIQPTSPTLPFSLSIPNTVDAKGFLERWWTHEYDIQTPTSIPFDEARGLIGAAIANNPTPGLTSVDGPASRQGTLNDALAYGTGNVRSFVVASPDPERYTDLVLNYTTPEHLVHEGFVLRFGVREPDGTTTLHSYGEGDSLWQFGQLNPQRLAVWADWEVNQGQIAAAVQDQLTTVRGIHAADPEPSGGSIADFGFATAGPPTDWAPIDFGQLAAPEDLFAPAPGATAVDPLDWFSATAPWDPGLAFQDVTLDPTSYAPAPLSFDEMWDTAWSAPTQMYYGDSLSVADFL